MRLTKQKYGGQDMHGGSTLYCIWENFEGQTFWLMKQIVWKILENLLASLSYRIVGYFRGGKFYKFHESSSIRENFTLEMPIFS